MSLDDRKRVVVCDPSSTGDPVLDGALGKNLRTVLDVRLVAEGVLCAEEIKALGIFPVRR